MLKLIIISLRWQWYLSGRSTSVHWLKNCCGSTSGWKPIHSPRIFGWCAFDHQASRSLAGSAIDVMYYSCCCCCSCNAACTQATGSVRYTECTEYFYRAMLCSGGICYGPVSIRLFVTSHSPAHNSRLQSHARIYAHSRWRCLNVLPCALQKWLNRSTAKPQTDSNIC